MEAGDLRRRRQENGLTLAALARATGRMEKLGASLLPVPARAVLGIGSPVEFLVDLAETEERSIIVMATRGLRGAAREVLGSTAREFAGEGGGHRSAAAMEATGEAAAILAACRRKVAASLLREPAP